MKNKEKPATKICKHCKTEIPYGAKICPQCRRRVKGGKGKWIVLGVLLLLLFAALSGGDDDEGGTRKVGTVGEDGTILEEEETAEASDEETEEETAADDGDAEETQTIFHVGDVLMDGDTRIVYISSGEYTEENEYAQPQDGYKYIRVCLAFENTSDQDDVSVSFYSFEGYADGYSVEMYYPDDGELGATLSAGRTTTGYLYFEVPEDAQEIEIEYETNVFTEEKITFVYEEGKDSGYVPEKNTEPTDGAYQPGDIVEGSDLIITYLSCENYESDNEFVQPKEGFHYVTCTFEIENTGDSDEYVSMYDFDCYADGAACAQTYIGDDLLDATLSAGRKTRGMVTFEVPDDAVVIEAEYLSDYWTSERVVFTIK